MIMKSAAKDVVCKVGENLLVRFKNPEEGKHPKSQAKQSDFGKKETDVSVCLCCTFFFKDHNVHELFV